MSCDLCIIISVPICYDCYYYLARLKFATLPFSLQTFCGASRFGGGVRGTEKEVYGELISASSSISLFTISLTSPFINKELDEAAATQREMCVRVCLCVV